MAVPGYQWASLLLLVGMILQSTTLAVGSSSPRLRLSHKELWHLNRTWAFDSPQGPLSPRTMLLDEHEERLFVGVRDGLFSLSLERVNSKHREISWASTAGQVDDCLMKGREKAECANYVKVLHQYNRTHLLACGTGAFDPICAFVNVGRWAEDGLFQLETSHIKGSRGRCPFDPNSSCTSVFSKGQLYVGLYTDYWENDAALCRYGDASFTRTEQNHRQQLNEPKFVGSVIIPDNDDPDDDKVYFFFTEKAADTEDGNSAVYSRIGRVCANDVGGQRMLVNKWTSFTKTRLVCSVPGSDGMSTHFDELVDVFVLKRKDEKKPEIFGLFSTTSNIFKGYAVCVYSMDEVRAAFNGPYAHKERPDHHWAAFQGRVPFPRPGSCASQMNGGQFSSSREYPDEVLRFIRTHPVMFQPVQPVHHRPILIRTDAEQRFTQIAVDRVEAEDGHYDVLFIGTDNSVVLKVITIHNKETNTIEEVVLEELHVFKVPVPITEILISSKRQRLFVSSELGVAQVRVHQCRLYGAACADCCLARDPYCAWDGVTCSRYLPAGISMKRRVRRQDVRHGNAIQQCNGMQINGGQLEKPEEKLVYGVEGNGTLLECSPRSLRANVVWLAQRGPDADEVKADDRVAQTPHGLLFLRLRRADSGVYLCQTEERGFIHTVARISLEVLEEERVEELLHQEGEAQHRAPCPLPGAPHSSTPRLWYKEFLQLIGYSNVHKVEEYCERVWCSNRGRKKLKSLNSKWKLSQAQERRGRTRVDHQRAPRHAPAT
ncbi:semaphorin-3E isoform X1 [Paramormyrops kingsleyae]|uniref:Sema domain, immunoglobulin domain (Ig), short basic domain, secreted, (semaphorin) 3E n=1 Tax=Paramormyrops kingsleyae TaxID=1676925 RepID=A0A3B3QS82_9TELE|nr:semaphorin-3E [Paramormyrops kingsleyae]